MPKSREISILNGYVERSKSLYPRAYDPYTVSRVTVGQAQDRIQYVLVESPMDHDEFKRHYRRLGKIGIMIPMVEMINCAIIARDVLDTRAGRSWINRVHESVHQANRMNIHAINRIMQACFKGLLKNACSDCRVLEYCDGVMVIEVRRVVDWNKLNRFESTVR